MISFRFHIVSITAIFLAIAVGVVVGSTYVDRAVVDTLQNRIDSVEGNLDDLRAERASLERERERLEGYAQLDAEFAVSERLVDVSVLLVAMRGIDGDPVEATALLTERSGAEIPGVLWVEEKWGLAGDDDVAELAAILESGSVNADLLREQAWEAVVGEVAAADESAGVDGSGAPTTTTAAPRPPVLEALIEAGFFTIEPLDDASPSVTELAGSGARFLFMTGTRVEAPIAEAITELAGQVADAGAIAVVAEVYVEQEDGPERGEGLTALLDEEVLGRLVVVDHADLVQGRVAAVLSLDAAADGVTGHFGYGPGAGAVLPRWSPP